MDALQAEEGLHAICWFDNAAFTGSYQTEQRLIAAAPPRSAQIGVCHRSAHHSDTNVSPSRPDRTSVAPVPVTHISMDISGFVDL